MSTLKTSDVHRDARVYEAVLTPSLTSLRSWYSRDDVFRSLTPSNALFLKLRPTTLLNHALTLIPLLPGPGTSSHTFLDRLNMTCTGGPGGRGSISFEHLPRSKRRPDGGNGAHGGSVFIRSNKKIQNLVRPTTPHLVAGAGGMGHGQKKHGKTGSNLIFQVPLGIIVKRVTYPNHRFTFEEWLNEGNDESLYDEKVIKTVADLNVDGSEVLVAEGGVGGVGNANYISLYGRDAGMNGSRGRKTRMRASSFEICLTNWEYDDTTILSSALVV